MTHDRIGPRALALSFTGTIGRTEVDAAFATIRTAIANGGPLDLLVDVRAPLDIAWLEALAAELRHAREIPALLKAARRIAVVADRAWIRVAARIEGALLPGVTYRGFAPGDAATARAWVLGDGTPATEIA